MQTPHANHHGRRAEAVIRGIVVAGITGIVALWLLVFAWSEGGRGPAANTTAIAGLATLALIGLVLLLIREISERATSEARLAAEQERLAAALREFEADRATRRDIEEQLRVAQATLKDAVDHLSEALVIYDADDRVVLHNEAMARLYPATAALLVPGTPYIEVMRAIAASGEAADAAGREENWVAEQLAAHRRASGAEEHKLADGRRVMTTERRMRNGGTAVLRVDITPLRRAEERQRELEAQLHHAQKLEAIGALAAGIAQDLNNTLTPVVALSQMALVTLPADSSERDDIEVIAAAGRRAQGLVQRLVSFSRKQQIVKRPVDLVRVVRQAVEMLRPSLPANIRLSPEIGAVPRLAADAEQLQQVVVDLVGNAVQAIGTENGTITVGLETHRPPRAADGRSEEYIRLSVADTGCGMDPQTLGRIFEPFFTTNEAGAGSGLGLTMVHGIVTAHGGTIRVRSAPHEGSEFLVMLPLSPVETAAEGAAAA